MCGGDWRTWQGAEMSSTFSNCWKTGITPKSIWRGKGISVWALESGPHCRFCSGINFAVMLLKAGQQLILGEKNIIKKCRDSDQLPHRLSYGTTQICCCFSSCAFSFLFVYLLFISASPQFRHLPALRIQTHSDPPGAVAIVIKIISDNKNNSVAICFYKQISSWDTAVSKHRQVCSYKYAQGNCRQRKTVIHWKYCCSEESQLWPLVPNYTWKQRLKAY